MTTPEQLRKISQEMKKFDINTADGRKERNALAVKWRESYRRCDFGFTLGEQVRCPISNRHRIYRITKITDDNRFLLDDDLIVSGILIERYEKEPEQMIFEI